MAGLVDRFNESVRRHDATLNADLLSDDVKLYGVPWKPFEGKEAVIAVFAMLQDIIEGLEYVAEYDGQHGSVLEVRGSVGGRQFEGTQILRFDSAGLISEFHDLIRPHSAGAALLQASGEYLAQQESTAE